MRCDHDDVIKWKDFPCYWPFVRVTGEFPWQREVTQSFDAFFDLCLNKRLSKQSWGDDLRCHHAHYDVIVMWDAMWGRQQMPTRESLIAARHSSLSSIGVLISEALLSHVSFWEYQERLRVVYLRFSYHEKVPRGWVHLQWVLGAAHSAQWVSLVSVLSCLTVWEGCPTSRYF